MLHFLSTVQNPRTDRLARQQVSFAMHPVHVDESAAIDSRPEDGSAGISSLSKYVGFMLDGSVDLLVVKLEDVFDGEAGPEARRQRLFRLLQASWLAARITRYAILHA